MNATLDGFKAQQTETDESARTVQTLQSALGTAQMEIESIKTDYHTDVTRLQRDIFDLRAALMKRDLSEGKPRLSVGIADFKRWRCERSVDADTLIFDPDTWSSSESSDMHHVLAHNALLKARLENWASAVEDAKKSIVSRPSTMGYIARALAHVGRDEHAEAMQVFDLAFGNCDPKESNLLLLIKTIILFVGEKHDAAISRVIDMISVSSDDETMYCCLQVLGKMYQMKGDYPRAERSLERGWSLASSCTGSDLEAISLIFGWTFNGLRVTVQRYHCEGLYASGLVEEALKVLIGMMDSEIHSSEVLEEWARNMENKCIERLESLGDAALASGEHNDAIARYTSILSLGPSDPIDILVKRSKARASKGLWKDALADANEVIKRNPSSHRGYERKHAALHGAGDYDEAIHAILRMLSIMENSPDEEIRRLRTNYTSPREIADAIESAIRDIFSLCPLVLIDVATGRLCDAQERIRMYKLEMSFKRLISETAATKIDHGHIHRLVAGHFKWIMFSHTWEGREPTFQDVNLVESVWSLDESPLNEKLRQFCRTARDSGGRWVWSDTCCIDKTTGAILSQSLTSMYTWYEEAEETIVYLADVLSFGELGDLTMSRWMTRAWTLQELLASKVIRFYTRDWKPYLNDKHSNHKESPIIKQELARAMGITVETVTSFQLVDLGVREKLQLASNRGATVEEDIAYSLIGIFSSDIVPRYGLGKTAIGQLLENVVARTGDVTVISWTGKSLPYNSALPASLAAYNQTPYTPPPTDANELHTRVEQLRTHLEPQATQALYNQVIQLPRATFMNRCLQLPCVIFTVAKIGVQELGGNQGTLYRATVPLLGRVEFSTVDVMPLKKPRKLVFAHPWLHDLRDPLDGFVSDDEREPIAIGSGGEPEARSDAGLDAGTDDPSVPGSPSSAEPLDRVDTLTKALRLISRLGRPFNALLLEQQPTGQYKRVASENEIILPGVPSHTDPKDVRVKVLEVI